MLFLFVARMYIWIAFMLLLVFIHTHVFCVVGFLFFCFAHFTTTHPPEAQGSTHQHPPTISDEWKLQSPLSTTFHRSIFIYDRVRNHQYLLIFLVFEFGKLRKVHPILSSPTATTPDTVSSTGDVDCNLASSFFLEFLNSFVSGKT